jgi:sugar/nucleoside kinase (ribokinase family)
VPERPARPDVVVVGAAARDVTPHDPRGWRLGGGVTYGALALARLGLRTGVVIGLDGPAMDAHELDLLRRAGADVHAVAIERGPVFHNQERPTGRVQTCLSTSAPVPVAALPPGWEGATAWLLAPVASELPDAWATIPPSGACVAFGWQGILRHLIAGERVRPIEPGPSALLERADLVGVSRHDLPRGLAIGELARLLGATVDLLVTAGPAGGLVLRIREGRLVGGRRYPATPARFELDPTGAGDTMLAGVVAARVVGHARHGRDVRLGSEAASLLVEAPGLDAVPTLGAIRERMASRAHPR